MKVYRDISDIEYRTDRAITVGSFDGVHSGHKDLLNELTSVSKRDGLSSFVVTFDPHPQMFFNCQQTSPIPFPLLTTLEEKLSIIDLLGVDEVYVAKFDAKLANTNYYEFITDILLAKIGFSVILVGDKHSFGKDKLGNYEVLKDIRNDTIHELKPLFEIIKINRFMMDFIRVSSTLIRQVLRYRSVEIVNTLLGYNYFIIGKVVKGKGIGRIIGFPTANIEVELNKEIPKNGVYVSTIDFLGSRYRSVTNIGVRPTMNSGTIKPVIEVHILNFAGDLYGLNVVLSFNKFLRDEKKFASIEYLVKQIEKDVADTISYFDTNSGEGSPTLSLSHLFD
ncbi:MAG: riboflavin biosynthesis protein RibF [Ignavibacteria bacterium]|jgi:riboflavin kinase/FMN adenylyltransferase|nr:riboflavin biosynthesis protein RibF [Ignavibacteria bacterium]